MLMKYVRTGFRRGAEHIPLGNPLALYTAVGYSIEGHKDAYLVEACGNSTLLKITQSIFKTMLISFCKLLI